MWVSFKVSEYTINGQDVKCKSPGVLNEEKHIFQKWNVVFDRINTPCRISSFSEISILGNEIN